MFSEELKEIKSEIVGISNTQKNTLLFYWLYSHIMEVWNDTSIDYMKMILIFQYLP